MGRKRSVKEKAATATALDILQTTKKENVRVKVTELLFESDAFDKRRADAQEKQRRGRARDNELKALHSEIEVLKTQIATKDKLIESEKLHAESVLQSAKEESETKISELKKQLGACGESNKNLKEEISIAQKELFDIESFLIGALEYHKSPEYKPSVLEKAVQARIKNEVPDEKRIQASKAIAMLDPEFEAMEEDRKNLATITSEKRDPVTLFNIGRNKHTDRKSRHEVWTSLQMLFGWSRGFELLEYDGNPEWEQGIRLEVLNLKRRPDEDILDSIRLRREQKLSLEQQRARVRDDNERARKLVDKISSYRQCSHCRHASHVRRTRMGAGCYHCGDSDFGIQAIEWLSIPKNKLPHCNGKFPCQDPTKPSN